MDDEEPIRFGLRTILESADDAEVVAEAADGAEAVSAAQTLFMSEATAKTYVSRMLTKLGLANRPKQRSSQLATRISVRRVLRTEAITQA